MCEDGYATIEAKKLYCFDPRREDHQGNHVHEDFIPGCYSAKTDVFAMVGFQAGNRLADKHHAREKHSHTSEYQNDHGELHVVPELFKVALA